MSDIKVTWPEHPPKNDVPFRVRRMKGQYYEDILKRAPFATAMVQDDDGNLWLTNGKGLWSFPTDACYLQPASLEIVE